MKFTRLEIPDVILCEPKLCKDERGYFTEIYRQDQLETFLGHPINFCQENESKSSYGILRGLHYQLEPYAQTKLVRVIHGSVLDVAVDLRRNSSTFGQHISLELTAENKKQLFIPKGFAHGFVVLSKTAFVTYKLDRFYKPKFERGIACDDPSLRIDWGLKFDEIKRSSKDILLPLFKDAEYFELSNIT
ncbi:MAG: dTDP-4-dehydrorhamnose 3,5-epimerase [Bacteroidota bacterium]|nr:dTDP-4-dehydrorhamnose 3,5-epimerase [Bacteroidota bacterium]